MNTSSLWEATSNPHRQRPKLGTEQVADAVIVGAGFTGLSAAYHLQKKGYRSIVLEQETVGWGASGRNGGMVLVGYKTPFSNILARWGMEGGKEFFQLSSDSVDVVEKIVNEHQIQCSYARYGQLIAAYKLRHMEILKKEQEAYSKIGYDTILLDRKELEKELNSPLYHGGLLDPISSGFHPLNFALGLADAAESMGAQIYEKSKVIRIDRKTSHVVIHTEEGKVIAKNLIMATDGYTTELTPKMHKGLVAVGSYMIATEPLEQEFLDYLIPRNRMICDTKHVLYYFRRTPDNRIAFGGKGDFKTTENTHLYNEIRKSLHEVFPQLEKCRIDYRWGGLMGFTLDQFPRIGKLEDGTLFAAGYSGHGAAMANLLGKLLADFAVQEERIQTRLETLPFQTIPFHNQRAFLVNMVSAYYRLLDLLA